MKLRILLTAFVATLLSSPWALGYNGATHALITYQAYKQSNLSVTGANSIQQRLGLDRLDPTLPFEVSNTYPDGTDAYYDNASVDPPTLPSLIYARAIQQEERDAFAQLINMKYFTATSADTFKTTYPGWLMRGAIREDDDGIVGINRMLDSGRDADPWGEIIRVLHHFYDPVNDRPLTVGNTPAGAKATDWSLGLTNALAIPDAENTNRREHFSLRDFYNNLYDALTLERDRNNDGIRDSGERMNDAFERKFRMATALKSLGHVVHLLQDMAQPQHTRNDAHADYINNIKKKLYEPYTELRVTGDSQNSNDPNYQVVRDFFGYAPAADWYSPIVLTGAASTYPAVSFPRAVQFFSTRNPVDSNSTIPQRMGMADFSNRNFFTVGTLPITNSYPYPSTNLSTFSTAQLGDPMVVGNQRTTTLFYTQAVQDPLNPSFQDTLPIWSGGKVPLATVSVLSDLTDLTSQATGAAALDIFNYRVMADVNIPRAIGYSAGFMNFALRGKLEITPISAGIFAVLDHGTSHTVDANGYPHPTASPNQIFGFQKVRLNLRNVTPPITDPTTGTTFAQVTGSNNNTASIVAVARYHRNTCYTPSLIGERIQDYGGAITEPTCGSGQVVRTNYQEISVSARLNVAIGELDNLSQGIEKDFDFTNDPIPVNATDLFIQVVYRGPLGSETSSIAVGNFDVSEPTYAAFWNNTDYFWNGSAWTAPPPSYVRAPAVSFNGCAGNLPVQWVYNFAGSAGNVALSIPPTSPNFVRLAFIFAPKNAGNYIVQGTPYMDGTVPNAPKEFGVTKGEIIQASAESVPNSVLATAAVGCAVSPPSTSPYWCFDVIQRRRGTIFGAVAQPIFYYSSNNNGVEDVDQAGQAPLTNATLRSGGTLEFNASGTLQSCPP